MAYIRTFIAVKIVDTPPIRKVFQQIRRALKEEGIKWVAPELLHITMKFIGETDERKIPLMVKRLNEAAVKSQSFRMNIKGCGVFPKLARPKVFWLGLEYPREMLELKNNIEEALQYLVPEDDKDFRPHLTLGRIKQRTDPDRIREVLDQFGKELIDEMIVDSFVLMQSQLKRSGPVYTPLKEFSLRNEE